MRYAPITDRLADTGSEKWAVHVTGRRLKAAGADIIELTIGEPDMPPDPGLLEVCARALYEGRTGYSNGRGEPALLAAIARRYDARRAGITEDNILCFPGAQTALYATLKGLTGPGDGVLVGDPYYATYEGVVGSSGAHIVPVPLAADDGFHLRAERLEAAITPDCHVLLLNNPHNPSGAVLEADEIAAIGEVCRRHNLWIVADEVYEELIFDGPLASPFDRPELAERVVALSSISKTHAAPGFRSGWAVGPADFCRRVLPLSEAMLFGNQPFIADMTAAALAGPSRTAPAMREAYRRRAGAISRRLAAWPQLRPLPPAAGMFIMVDIRATGLSSADFAWSLLKGHQVSVMPGSSFGACGEGFIRMSLTVPDEALARALDRIETFLAGLS